MCEDGELLKRYSETGDEDAFAELVQRHINFVYSVALRQVRDPHLAEDITQSVFLKLARRSASLPQGVVLAGWLHSDTRFASLEIMRKERRRAAREIIPMEAIEENNWAELQPVIDDVLSELDTAERDAVLLRFFHERSFAEIGAALRLAPDAARMRVNRALDKLRDLLEKRGIKTTASALSATLLAHSIQAAPTSIASRIMGSLPGLATSSATPFWLSKGLLAGAALVAVAVALFILIRKPAAITGGNTIASERPVPAPSEAATQETQPPNLTSTTSNEPLARKTLALKVVDGNSAAPLQRVEVKWWTFTDVLKSRSETFFTGSDGLVGLSYPVEHARDFHFRAHLAVDGYVPRYVSWSVFQHDQLEDIPSEYTAKMDRGIEIGGLVRDINNQPIADVKVIFTGPSPVGVPSRERDTVMGSYHTETTDANGVWRCNHVRPEFASTTFKLEHPFFRSVTYGCRETDQPSIAPTLLPAADFLARRAEMIMERGLIVSGVGEDADYQRGG